MVACSLPINLIGISEEMCFELYKTCQLHVAGVTKLQTVVQSQAK